MQYNLNFVVSIIKKNFAGLAVSINLWENYKIECSKMNEAIENIKQQVSALNKQQED